jgi:hypothetical protein
MTEAELPHRAKPELLHEISRLIRQNGQMGKSEIYDSIDQNRKTVRRTLQYGVLLGFLKEEDDQFKLIDRGNGLSYNPQFDGQEAVMDTFREAIEEYQPYREAIAGVYALDKIDDVKDVQAVTQDSFREELQKSVRAEVQDREVNVLIKTAQAAGLGDYKAGRRGYQTRLNVSEEFEPYAASLAESYPLPSEEEEEPAEGETKHPETERGGEELVQQPITKSVGESAEPDGETVTHVHIHVWADDEDDAVSTRESIVERIKRGGT